VKRSLVVAALVVACTNPDTILRIDVTDAPTIDTLQFRIGSDATEADALSSIDLAIPDRMAGESETLEVWGLATGQQVAYGTTTVTPSLHATTDVAVALSAIACGPLCVEGSVECVGSAAETCSEGSDGCLAWLPSSGTCTGSAAPPPVACSMDGSPCDDYNACTQHDTCQAGYCSGEPLCTTAPANADPVCSNGTCGFACHTGYVSSGSGCIVPQYVFATSGTYMGNLGGLAGADATCQSLATAAGLAGTFKAWLSDTTTNAADRLSHGSGYVLVDGTLVAATWTQLTSGDLAHGIDLDEHGSALANPYVWTDTNISGDAELSLNQTANSCTDWTNSTYSSSEVGPDDLAFGGEASATDGDWTATEDSFACDGVLHLYCLQQ
jgi:hypothetical protein